MGGRKRSMGKICPSYEGLRFLSRVKEDTVEMSTQCGGNQTILQYPFLVFFNVCMLTNEIRNKEEENAAF